MKSIWGNTDVLFTEVANGATVQGPLFRVEGGRCTRWILAAGTVSQQAGNTEHVHLRVEILEDATGTVVWDRDIWREFVPGSRSNPLELLSSSVTGLVDGASYSVRLRTMGSAELQPVDGFFVVAIDMDDGPAPRVTRMSKCISAPKAGAPMPMMRSGRGRKRPAKPARRARK
jgi:hypothetical protein